MKEVGIYVHIPYCQSKCKYCSFVSTVNFSTQEKYVEKLTEEIVNRQTDDLVTSIYIGGGTPSVLKSGLLSRIFTTIYANYQISDDCEITVEANPESVLDEFLLECKQCGVNRLSIGLQCADDEILANAGRRHTVWDFRRAVRKARHLGFDNISADLIVGLEGEINAKVAYSIKVLARIRVDHISVYSLSVEKGCIMYAQQYRPDEDKMSAQYDLCVKHLRKAGYERYEVSNFALNSKVSRHNNKYWLGINYLGFGVAAHSYYDGVRTANTSSVTRYINGEAEVEREVLTNHDMFVEYMMLRLRLSEGISFSECKQKFGVNLLVEKAKKIDRLLWAGVIQLDGDRLWVEDKGFYVLNYIITELI